MLVIEFPQETVLNSVGEQVTLPELRVELEHSLVSISKWEAAYEKPFFNKEGLNAEEMETYIKQMVVGSAPSSFYSRLNSENIQAIVRYMESKQTATWFPEETSGRPTREIVTNEIVYNWMIDLEIPFECQYWHINHLMTFIRVRGAKKTKPKKMSKQALAEQMRKLNEERKAKLGTTG